ncbi:MAG: 4'-phosphopantetheinyl transferase superfamily protein [Bacteroidetes bacterium]|jgi:phosphopantetheinyl transferase (holo-ACP synthase)|nr:4'-phosphopantetheinyl transferase superfamily protein [Bacteroidota bacterium]
MIAVDFLSREFMDAQWSRKERIAKKILTPDEYSFWLLNRGVDSSLFKFWLAKEATYKMANRRHLLPRTFAPRAIYCKWETTHQFHTYIGQIDFEGFWQGNAKGLMALIAESKNVEIRHFWTPFRDGNRLDARVALKKVIREAEVSRSSKDISPFHFSDLCRSYSAPWSLCSVEM